MTKDEAMKMALEALEKTTEAFLDTEGSHGQIENEAWDAAYDAQEAIRQALAESNNDDDYWRKKAEHLEQENFGWRTKLNVRGYEIEIESLRQALAEPPKWVHLLTDEKEDIRKSVDYSQFMSAEEYACKVQDATEAKLKELNHD